MNQSPEPNPEETLESRPKTSIKVFVIGDGARLVAETLLSQSNDFAFAFINTDPRQLKKGRFAEKLCIGSAQTRGMGIGGDPELGRLAAEEEIDSIRRLCVDVDLAIILSCLGGGTGSGISAVVARVAQEAGAKVLAIVTLPFSCEGSRRRNQAQAALQRLKVSTDGVIFLSNEKLLKLVSEESGVTEVYKLANEMIGSTISCFTRLFSSPGIIKISFSDLCGVLRGRCVESGFARVEASGENMGKTALEALFVSPGLEGGQALARADGLLVSILGGPDLKMAQVDWVASQLQTRAERAQVALGTAVSESYRGRIVVSVFFCRRDTSAVDGGDGAGESGESEEPVFPESSFLDRREIGEAQSRSSSRFVPPTTPLTPERREQILAQHKRGSVKPSKQRPRASQGQLPLDIVPKGRFDKSEPTIHEGEDLDIPTYIRRGISLN